MEKTDKSVDERRLKAREVADKYHRKERNKKLMVVAALILTAVAIIGIVFGVQSKSRNTPVAAPNNVDGYTIPVSQGYEAKGEKVPVTIIQDYNCPGCAQLHLNSKDDLSALSKDGIIDLKYNNVAILDNGAAGKDASMRAANAAACVVNESPESFVEFNERLLRYQEPNHAGMTNEALVSHAIDSGAENVESCINDETYKAWATQAHFEGTKDITKTPTVLIDGEELADNSDLVESIEAAHEKLNS